MKEFVLVVVVVVVVVVDAGEAVVEVVELVVVEVVDVDDNDAASDDDGGIEGAEVVDVRGSAPRKDGSTSACATSGLTLFAKQTVEHEIARANANANFFMRHLTTDCSYRRNRSSCPKIYRLLLSNVIPEPRHTADTAHRDIRSVMRILSHAKSIYDADTSACETRSIDRSL